MTDQPAATVAAFDLDGTLTNGGSVFHWLTFLAGRPRTWRAAARLALPLTWGAVRSGRWADDAKERLFVALLAGREEAAVREASRAFALEHLARHRREDVLERLAWHQRAGHHTVIVSASPQPFVDVMAELLGVDGAIGTRLQVGGDGRLSGRYDGRNCRGTEKVRRLDEWLATRAASRPAVLYAYGNSRGDRRMLQRADRPFSVARLGRASRLRHLPRLGAPPWDD